MVRWLLSVKRLEEETVVRECSRFFVLFSCVFAFFIVPLQGN